MLSVKKTVQLKSLTLQIHYSLGMVPSQWSAILNMSLRGAFFATKQSPGDCGDCFAPGKASGARNDTSN
jgi:hypothetical protein